MDRRIESLDGLRAIAILSVLLTHTWEAPAFPILNNLAHHAQAGVDLFFVLSGFLITGVLLDSRGKEGYYRNFYGRRMLRIWPVYYLFMLLVFVLWPTSTYLTQVRADWPWYTLFAANVILAVQGPQLKLTDITWSLGVEEQFYFVWPTIVRRFSVRALARICIAIIMAVPIARLVALGHMHPFSIRFSTPFRIDEFAIGGLVCLVARERRFDARALQRWGWRLLVGAGTLFLATSAFDPQAAWYGDSLQFSVTGIAAGGLLLLALYSPGASAALTWRPLRHIGMVSYGMYLYHEIVYIGLSKIAEKADLHGYSPLAISIASFLSVTVVTTLVATLSYRCLESPLLRLKRFFVPRGRLQSDITQQAPTPA